MPANGYEEEAQKRLDTLASQAVNFRLRISDYVLPSFEMSQREMGLWVQSGLALAPFCGAQTRCAPDWVLAWSLLEEWACHHLFPVPTTFPWPRHGRTAVLWMNSKTGDQTWLDGHALVLNKVLSDPYSGCLEHYQVITCSRPPSPRKA